MSEKIKYRSLRGMPDIFGEEAALMRWVEDKARKVFNIFGYREIRTPMLEETSVFTRSIGEDTDIVEKEMYSFTDRGGKNISLRPEGTASIIRAYIEHGWHNTADLVKLFYTGPMFRGERPQKGRLRQFHQVGAEIIGGSSPYIDAELICSLNDLLKKLKVGKFTILLNSLGCAGDRAHYKRDLAQILGPFRLKLCDNCQRRSKTNVLRVLDCKRKECRAIVEKMPSILTYLCSNCFNDYETLKDILREAGVDFQEKKDLVRGLDYYTKTIFEVVHPSLGAQDTIAAGGRYDDLTKQMGGPDVGATGYAIGVERMLLIIDRKKIHLKSPEVFVVPVGEGSRMEASQVTNYLRMKNVSCEMDHSGRSLKGQMRRAHKEGWEYVIILGEEEIKNGKLLLKSMETGEQHTLFVEEVVECLKMMKREYRRLGRDSWHKKKKDINHDKNT